MKDRVNVLFTSVGRRVELLRAFRRAYADLGMDGEIVGVDRDPLAPALRESTRSFVVPGVFEDDYIPTLTDICRNERVDVLFPLIDPEISLIASRRAELEADGTTVMVVPSRSAAIVADKLQTHDLFRRLGVPSPRTWTPEQALGRDLDFPVFLKPRYGSAGEDAMRIDGPEALGFFLKRVPDPLVQDLLDGPEVTSDVLCGLGGEVLAVVSRRRIEVRSGEVSKGVTIADPAILQHCVTIARGLQAIGPITIQCMLQGDAPFFTEVNARLGGGLPLAIAAGVPIAHALLGMASGREVEVPPLGTYEVGLYLSRFDESFFVREEERADVSGRRVRP